MNLKRMFAPCVIILLGLMVITSCGANMRLTEIDNGKKFEAPKGTVISLSLPSNPTTGYTWLMTDNDTNVLQIIGDSYKRDSDLIGAGGVQTWKIKAVRSGSALFRIAYRREFEPKTIPPVKTFTVTVVVQ